VKSALFALLATLFLCGPSVADPYATSPRSNVLFIMTDQQFGEAMSCRMGRKYLHTPTMDGLAAGGMVFTRAYAANPLCMPSRNSIFTGRYPHETGVTRNENPKGGLNSDELACMGRIFREAGYETAYSGKWHLCYNPGNAAAHGFDSLLDAGKGGGPGGGPDARAADAASKFLAGRREKPFLLVVSFLNPHNICEWARRAAGRPQNLSCGEIGTPPPPEELPPPPDNLAPPAGEPDGMTLIRRAYQVEKGLFPVAKFTPEDWRRQRWGYFRMVEKVDGEMGRVLAALRQSGLEENTLIVFTSDHGECAGAHGFNQKTVFYEESVRVPLIVAWKGRTVAGTSDRLVNTGIDILPTLLDGAGLGKPAKLTGRSLWPLSLGKATGEWRDHVVLENDMAQGGEVDGLKPMLAGRMVRTERYKYCLYSHGLRRESLVDLQADPGETADLAADPKAREVLLAHRELLARFGREHGDSLAAELLADDVKPIPFKAKSR